MKKYIDLAAPLRICCGIIFLSIVLLTLAQVVARYAFDSPLLWSEELVRMLLVWLVFLGSAVVCWDGGHLSVNTFFGMSGPKVQAGLRLFNLAVALVFLAVLAWFSIPLIEIELMINMGSLPIPLSFVRIPAPVGGVLMIGFILLRRFYRLPREAKGNTSKEVM